MACASRLTAANTSAAREPVGPRLRQAELDLLLRPATRISKNSSMFEETMVMKRSRSSSGTRLVGGLREDPPVELEDLELPVEELRRLRDASIHGERFMACGGRQFYRLVRARPDRAGGNISATKASYGTTCYVMVQCRATTRSAPSTSARTASTCRSGGWSTARFTARLGARRVVRLGAGSRRRSGIDRATAGAGARHLAKFAGAAQGLFAPGGARGRNQRAAGRGRTRRSSCARRAQPLGFPIE